MLRLIRRMSFTTKLIALASCVLGVLIVVDYVTLLELPGRVAEDSVEIALREDVQALNFTFRADRLDLVAATGEFVKRADVARAVRAKDEAALRRLIDESSIGDDVDFRFIRAQAIDGSGLGAITSSFVFPATEGEQAPVVFFRPVTDDVLDRAAAQAGGDVSFALELDDKFVARSAGFSRELGPAEIEAPLDLDQASMEPVRVDGDNVHLYSRPLTSDSDFTLYALSTPELEAVALSDIRSDVRSAIAGMAVATTIGFLILVVATSRTVRGFARRVRTLADGDYGSRFAVRGNDAFADLASSVNRLSEELAERVGQLEDTADGFRRMLETLDEGICVWSADGTVQFWNRGAEQLTGLARERALPDDTLVSFLHAERAPGTRRVTLPIRRSGGGLVVDLVVTAMPDGGIVQTFRDTTMVDKLQQTQRNFMATAAHELRTPITTILGFADSLTNPDLELTDRQRAEFLTIVREQSHHLQEIADAFFTNHQLANERVEVSIRDTNLELVVEDVLDHVRRDMPERESDVDAIGVDVEPRTMVLADRQALAGVVGILVENALKYGEAPISIVAERKGGTISLCVRDEGPGIDPYHQARIFDPFYRIDVDMRSGVGGAGLGLFTARKLIEAMHGIVRVQSTPGAGTTFAVELPASPGGAKSPADDSPLRLVG